MNGASPRAVASTPRSLADLGTGYEQMDRNEEALRIKRAVYAEVKRLRGPADTHTILNGTNLANQLLKHGRFAEATRLARGQHVMAQQELGEREDDRIRASFALADALTSDPAASRSTLLEAEAICVDLLRTTRNVFGPRHRRVVRIESLLEETREALEKLQP